jgi:hypothetical protein
MRINHGGSPESSMQRIPVSLGQINCCSCHVLYNQLDFVNAMSLLEETYGQQGFGVLFWPKFHCEVSMIESCWGAAKRYYRELPLSSSEQDLKKMCLPWWIPSLLTQCDGMLFFTKLQLIYSLKGRYAMQCQRFIDAYCRGLNGKQAAWAAKKYRGHQVLLEKVLEDLEEHSIE